MSLFCLVHNLKGQQSNKMAVAELRLIWRAIWALCGSKQLCGFSTRRTENACSQRSSVQFYMLVLRNWVCFSPKCFQQNVIRFAKAGGMGEERRKWKWGNKWRVNKKMVVMEEVEVTATFLTPALLHAGSRCLCRISSPLSAYEQ